MRRAMGLRLGDIATGAPVVPKSTLVNDLVAYYSLDETSGTRVDLVGDRDLTDNNTVGSDTGINNKAAAFVAGNLETLSTTETFGITGTTPFSVSFWFKISGNSAYATIIGNKGTPGWIVYNGNMQNIYAEFGASYREGVASVGELHLGVVTYDGVEIGVSVDGGALGTTAYAGGVGVEATAFALGRSNGNFWDGLIDEVGIWVGRILTTDEIAELYNSGSGKFYNATSEDFEE